MDGGQAKSLLVVDDDGSLVELVSFFLRHEGFDIRRGKDGIDAFWCLLAHPPSLLLIDLHLPCITGLEVIAQIRADPRTARVPIVAMSADPRLCDRAAAVGANAVLTKPFSRDKLLDVLTRFIAEPGNSLQYAGSFPNTPTRRLPEEDECW